MTIPAGRITRLFGTDGGVMLSLYPAFPEDFDTDTPLVVTIDGLDVPLYCDRFERRGVSGAAAAFADFDTERRAQELLGLEFLIGFAVEAEEAGSAEKRSGILADYYDSDLNPLFELEIAGRRVLVPAAEEFIAHIDFEGRTVHLVLPGGLLDMQ